MDIELYGNFTIEDDEFNKIIKDNIEKFCGKVEKIVKDEDCTFFGCELFGTSIEKDDYYTNFVLEEYKLNVNKYVRIEIPAHTYVVAIGKIFKLFANIINMLSGDIIILETASSIPVFKRISGNMEFSNDEELIQEIEYLKNKV